MFPSGNAVLWGNPVNRNCPLNQGLLNWWLVDSPSFGSATWHDLCGRSHGTLTSGPTWETGLRPGGLRYINFDGTDDYVSTPVSMTATSLTISCWAYITTRKAWQGIVFSRGTSVTGIHVSPGATKLGYTWNDDANTWNWSGGPSLPASEWVFLCVSVAASSAVAYTWSVTNGFLSATNSTSHSSTTINSLRIGMDSLDPTNRSVVGRMDDVRIYDRALSQSDVTQLCTESRLGYPTALNRYPR